MWPDVGSGFDFETFPDWTLPGLLVMACCGYPLVNQHFAMENHHF